MENSQYHYYASVSGDLSARVFGASHESQRKDGTDLRAFHPADPAALLSFRHHVLHIPAFVINKWGQRYISPRALDIDLRRLPASRYRIIAMHNFRVEDRNPKLDECLAGIFLARRIDRRWEEAEDHPLECRGLELLGTVDSATRVILAP